MSVVIEKENGNSDTLWELIDCWAEANLCEVKQISSGVSVWNQGEKSIILDHSDQKRDLGLTGDNYLRANELHEDDIPWTFWVRHPRHYNLYRSGFNPKPYSERSLNSMFIGRFENSVQERNRPMIWSYYVDQFVLNPGRPSYNHTEYLNCVSSSRFGLCLPGYGPKCNRDIELMGLGTVPIVTPGVCTRYYNPIKEGVHYVRVDHPEEIPDKIQSISESEWEEMSRNCLDWYEKNCSIEGSFLVTKHIIENEFN